MDFESRVREMQRQHDKSFRRMKWLGLAWAMICLAGAIGVVAVAWHFIAKWW